MGDLSTREQIRGEAFRRIFNVIIDRCRHNGPWSQAWDACVDCHQLATDAVDALGDLLPTEGHAASVYVGTAPDGSPRAVFEDIADAQTWVAKMIAARGDHRYGYVTAPWTPQTEATK